MARSSEGRTPQTDGGTSTSGTDQTDETLLYGAGPDAEGGTVTVTVSTTDDEGIRTHDADEVEVEVPYEGALHIEMESDEVELLPALAGGNPRLEDTGTDQGAEQ